MSIITEYYQIYINLKSKKYTHMSHMTYAVYYRNTMNYNSKKYTNYRDIYLINIGQVHSYDYSIILWYIFNIL